MNEGRLNVGVVDELVAEAFGQPGERTFRLKATTSSGEVALWMEKEQLVVLGAAVEQILERVPKTEGISPKPVTAAAQVTGEVIARVGSISLGFDYAQSAFVLEARDLRDATLDVQTLLLLATRGQLSTVEEQVDEIVAAGRPRCPMCGTPLTEQAHFCPPSNGHARVQDA